MIDALKCLLMNKHWESAQPKFEMEDSQSGMKVEVTGLPRDCVLVNIPAGGKSHSGMIDNHVDYKRSCDNLILIDQSNCIDVYFVEMKKTLRLDCDGIPQKPCDQIFYTVPVLDYLVSMARIHFQHEHKINRHFVVIAKKMSSRMDKQRVKPKAFEKFNYKGETFKIIRSSPSIPFQKLR